MTEQSFTTSEVRAVIMTLMVNVGEDVLNVQINDDLTDVYDFSIEDVSLPGSTIYRLEMKKKEEKKRYVTVELTQDQWEMYTIGGTSDQHMYVGDGLVGRLPIVRGVEGGPGWGDDEDL